MPLISIPQLDNLPPLLGLADATLMFMKNGKRRRDAPREASKPSQILTGTETYGEEEERKRY